MKPTTVAAFALPLVSASLESQSECISQRSSYLASQAVCGDRDAAASCLSGLGSYFIQSDVERCFLNAGCGPDEASVEAIFAYRRCNAAPEYAQDLRKRQARTTANTANDDETPTPTNTRAPAQTTTPAARQTSSSRNQVESSADSETAQPTTEGSTASPDTVSTTTKLTCFTTTTIQTTTCLTENGDFTCKPTTVEKPTCSAGLLCRLETGGEPVCMKLQNSLTTGGIIISIFFASFIVIAIGLMTLFCCREKSKERKLAAKAEAAAILKANAAGGAAARRQARNVSDRQPLMSEGQPQGYGQPIDDTNQNPFHDQNRAGH